MATLYLHIGLPKTGTTAIQYFCRDNQDELERRGIYFPLFPELNFSVQNAKFIIMSKLAPDNSQCLPEEGECWKRCMDRIEEMSKNYPNILLSEERIWPYSQYENPELLSALKRDVDARGFQLKVIVYLRRQDLYISSFWSQRIKTNSAGWGVMKWEDALARTIRERGYDYYEHLECIASLFGRENIIVRIYDRERFVNGDVISDFLSVLGLQLDDGFKRKDHEANPSLSSNIREIRRLLNTMFDNKSIGNEQMMQAALKCSPYEEDKGMNALFSKEELTSLLEMCEESNRKVARDYLGIENEPLFTPPQEFASKWEADNPRMYEDIIRFFGALCQAQQEEIEALQEKFYFRRKLKRFVRVKLLGRDPKAQKR